MKAGSLFKGDEEVESCVERTAELALIKENRGTGYACTRKNNIRYGT
jgi:hypothetical protein